MKLASLRSGRDGRLVVVSADLAWCAPAYDIAPTLRAALDDWTTCEPKLRALAETLEHGGVPQERFHEHEAMSPLPRAYLWLAGEKPAPRHGADSFSGPRDPMTPAEGLSVQVAVITGDVAQGADRDVAAQGIRLVMLGVASPLAAAFSPVAVTPDALPGWAGGKLAGELDVELNGGSLGAAGVAGVDFAALVALAAAGRSLAAGTIVGAVALQASQTLKAADVVRIELRDERRHSVFGAIEQDVRAG